MIAAALCLAGQPVLAGDTAAAAVTAGVVTSGIPNADAASVMSNEAGMLTISIPGAPGGAERTIVIDASRPLPAGGEGGALVLSVTDARALQDLIAQLTASGGTLTLSGQLSGKGVQIVVTRASPCSGAACDQTAGTITAVVTYN